MPRYSRFEKTASRGTLGHDVATDGLILRQRSRRGVNKKTGRVGGGRGGSTSTYVDEAAVRAAFDERVKELDAFEAKQKVKLPVAYRTLAMKYGAGDLLDFVRINVPRAKGRQRLESLVKLAEAAEAGDLFPFADSGGGDLFGWRFPSAAVYFLEHGTERPRKVAADFDAFMRGLSTNQRFVERIYSGFDADPTFTAR